MWWGLLENQDRDEGLRMWDRGLIIYNNNNNEKKKKKKRNNKERTKNKEKVGIPRNSKEFPKNLGIHFTSLAKG